MADLHSQIPQKLAYVHPIKQTKGDREELRSPASVGEAGGGHVGNNGLREVIEEEVVVCKAHLRGREKDGDRYRCVLPVSRGMILFLVLGGFVGPSRRCDSNRNQKECSRTRTR